MDERKGDPLGKFIREVEKGQENALEITKKVLDGGKENVTIALRNRKLQPEPLQPPQRKESPGRAHAFQDVKGFVAYLGKYKSKDTVVFADTREMTVYAVLDEKAQNGFEVVTFQPAVHPLFMPWNEVVGKVTEIRLFAEFLLRNRRVIVEPDARALVLTFSQIRLATKTTMNMGRGLSSINGVMVETEIQGTSDKEPVDLPEMVKIKTPLFVETSEVELELDLLMSPAGDGVAVTVSSGSMAEKKYEAFGEMLAEVAKIEGVVISLGRPGSKPWDYLEK